MNSDSTPRTIIGEGPQAGWPVSAPVINPLLPHAFSPHLRWTERPDGTFTLEQSCLPDMAEWPENGPPSCVWREVALWKSSDKTPV